MKATTSWRRPPRLDDPFRGDGFGYGSAMAEGTAPTLLFVVGPPAVGKMTVGREISKRTGLRLFHHHLSAELVLPFFDFGSPAFDRLVDRFRRHLIEEVAASDLPGLIFTYIWAYDLPGEQKTLERYAHPFQRRDCHPPTSSHRSSTTSGWRPGVGAGRSAQALGTAWRLTSNRVDYAPVPLASA